MTLHIGYLFAGHERASDPTGFHPWGCCDGEVLERDFIDSLSPDEIVTFKTTKHILHGEDFKILTKTGELKWL